MKLLVCFVILTFAGLASIEGVAPRAGPTNKEKIVGTWLATFGLRGLAGYCASGAVNNAAQAKSIIHRMLKQMVLFMGFPDSQKGPWPAPNWCASRQPFILC